MNWTIEKETRTKKTEKGNYYTQTMFVVWHDRGFNSFTTFEQAEEFVNNLK
jgi:hypothetical protein